MTADGPVSLDAHAGGAAPDGARNFRSSVIFITSTVPLPEWWHLLQPNSVISQVRSVVDEWWTVRLQAQLNHILWELHAPRPEGPLKVEFLKTGDYFTMPVYTRTRENKTILLPPRLSLESSFSSTKKESLSGTEAKMANDDKEDDLVRNTPLLVSLLMYRALLGCTQAFPPAAPVPAVASSPLVSRLSLSSPTVHPAEKKEATHAGVSLPPLTGASSSLPSQSVAVQSEV